MLRWVLFAALLAACTPSGNGGGGDCRDADDECAGGFICAAVTPDRFECRAPCNDGACPVGQICDPFSEACIPGDALPGADGGPADRSVDDGGPVTDAAVGGDGGPVTDAEIGFDAQPVLDAQLRFDAQPMDDAQLRFDAQPPHDSGVDAQHRFDAQPWVDGAVGIDAERPRDFGVDAQPPEQLLEGDWRLVLVLPSANPQPMLLRLTLQEGRSPLLNAVRNFCGDHPCGPDEERAWGPIDERTNDIDLQLDGDRVILEVFGGLGLSFESNPYGANGDLGALALDGRRFALGEICGTAELRMRFEDRAPLDAMGVPFLMEFVGEWPRRAPDINRVFNCLEP